MMKRYEIREFTLRRSVFKYLLFSLLFCSAQLYALQNATYYQNAMRYSDAGLLLGQISPARLPQLSNFAATRYLYELADRPTLITAVEYGVLASWEDESVSPSDWTSFYVRYVDRYTYDDYGRKEFFGRTNSSGEFSSLKQFGYDSRSRLQCEATRMNKALLSPSQITQAACELTNEDPIFGPDRITKYTYDFVDNITVITKALLTDFQQDYATYTYFNGRLETAKDANGNLTRYQYDGLARLYRTYFPHKNNNLRGAYNPEDYEQYSYDKNGNRTYFKKRSEKEVVYKYNKLNHLTAKDYFDTSWDDIVYSYNLLGLPRQVSYGNAETGNATPGRGIYIGYNGFGEKAVERSEFGIAHENNYLYDDHGNLAIRWSGSEIGNFQLGFTYNDKDQLTSIRDSHQNGSAYLTFSYSDLGPQKFTFAGGSMAYWHYDQERLTILSNNFYGSTYDVTQHFTFSPSLQITERTLSNDLYHHLDSIGVQGTYFTNGLNQYSSVGGASFSYDDDGNLTGDGVNTYVYDFENRLVSVRGQNYANLNYDALGRLYEVNSSASTYFTYDGDNVIREYSNVSDQHAYFHAGNMRAPVLDFSYDGTGWNGLFLATNHQGSVVAGADSDGYVENGFSNTYDVYGMPGGTNMGRFGYTGQMWLPEIGMYHYRARVYNPAIGRFLQTDPVGYEDQMNLYAYVGNDPMNFIDPTGEARRPSALDKCNKSCQKFAGELFKKGIDKGVKAYKSATAKPKSKSKLNKLAPVEGAEGAHSVSKVDPKTGSITRTETYTPNAKNPSGFDKTQSTDVTGKPHINKKTGEAVPTPHTQGKGIEGGVRPAKPEEIPKS